MIHAKARLRKFKSQIHVHTRAAQPQASFQAEATPRSIMGPGGRFSKGSEKQFLKLWFTGSEKVLFYYVSDIRKSKITDKFQTLKYLLIEDTKGFNVTQKAMGTQFSIPSFLQ